MTAEQWAAAAGKAQGERNALIDVIRMAVETLRDYNDPAFAKIILESILLAVETKENLDKLDGLVANDNVKARA